MKRVFLVFLLLFAGGATAFARDAKELDAPPAGITPSNVTVAQILKTYDAAAGALAPGVADTANEEWVFTKAGLGGTETLVRNGLDYYSRIAAGPLVEEYGQLDGHAWHRDYNGIVSPLSNQDATSFEMLLLMGSMNDAADPKNDVKVLGEVSDPAPAYVVSVKTTAAKHPEFVYYDKRTGLIDRISFAVDGERVTISYSDYRPAKGLVQPWHVHVTDGQAGLDDDFTRKSVVLGGDVNPLRFIMPPSQTRFATFTGKVKLPASVFWDQYDIGLTGGEYVRSENSPTLVVRLNVGGRGLDFAVSAGEPRTLIDFDVAQELQLPTYGQTTHSNGKVVPYDTILPAADIGPLMLRNFAVRATPFHYHVSGTTKVVGVIGSDALRAGVFKIDYDNGTLELYPAQDYGNPPIAGDQQSMIPILFDDGYPFFQGLLDSHPSENILFDNDFEMSFLFGGFAQRFPDSVKDAITGRGHSSATIPFADSNGYGQDVSVFLGKIPDIQFGPAHFSDYQIMTIDGDISRGGHEVDAVMGGDVLQYYDIYLDYPHNRVFLEPNKSFFKFFKVK